MRHFAFIVLCLVLGACSKSSVMSPLKDVGCAAESAVTGAAGGVVAAATGASDPAACSQALQLALGNVNLCATPLPATPGMVAQSQIYKTVGDIPADALKKKPGMVAQGIQIQGIVGSIVCPIADSAIIGLLSSGIPKACQGPNSLTAAAANQALVAACIAAVPI